MFIICKENEDFIDNKVLHILIPRNCLNIHCCISESYIHLEFGIKVEDINYDETQKLTTGW